MNPLQKLRAGMAVAALAVAGYASAEVYTLSAEAIAAVLPKDDDYTEQPTFSTEIKCNEVTWAMEFVGNRDVCYRWLYGKVQLSGYVTIAGMPDEKFRITTFSLSSDFFANKKVTNVKFNGALYKSGATGTETFSVSIGETKKEQTTALFTSYLGGKIPDMEFSFEPAASGGNLTLCFYSESGGQFAFKSLEITYVDEGGEELPENLEVKREMTVPVGYPVMLNVSDPRAAVYYTTDGSEDWLTYDAARGIVFSTPGSYTLKYYANYRDLLKTAITTEEIKVVSPQGIQTALAANTPIKVTGIVVGQMPTYTLIADTDDAAAEECLAIDNSEYPTLKTAAKRATISLVGRATDKFGKDVPALGSLSEVTVNNESQAPTNVTTIRTSLQSSPRYFDLQGRPAVSSASRLVISSDGTKHFRR